MTSTALADDVEAWSGKGRGDENFPVGALVRPRLRPHVHAYYAFARNADDIADSPALRPDDKLARLDRMEAVLLGRADTGSASALRLRTSLAETGVTSKYATDLLTAFRQDATKRRYATWAELLDYCRFSAMPVGRHVLALHGEDPATFAPSDPLCAALQVLNHLQDGKKDLAELDRCYLPEEWLEAAGTHAEALSGPAETPGLRRVFALLLDQVDQLNAQAAALPRLCRGRRLRVETGTILGLSRRLAARLRRNDPVAGRVKLTKADASASLFAALRYV